MGCGLTKSYKQKKQPSRSVEKKKGQNIQFEAPSQQIAPNLSCGSMPTGIKRKQKGILKRGPYVSKSLPHSAMLEQGPGRKVSFKPDLSFRFLHSKRKQSVA